MRRNHKKRKLSKVEEAKKQLREMAGETKNPEAIAEVRRANLVKAREAVRNLESKDLEGHRRRQAEGRLRADAKRLGLTIENGVIKGSSASVAPASTVDLEALVARVTERVLAQQPVMVGRPIPMEAATSVNSREQRYQDSQAVQALRRNNITELSVAKKMELLSGIQFQVMAVYRPSRAGGPGTLWSLHCKRNGHQFLLDFMSSADLAHRSPFLEERDHRIEKLRNEIEIAGHSVGPFRLVLATKTTRGVAFDIIRVKNGND